MATGSADADKAGDGSADDDSGEEKGTKEKEKAKDAKEQTDDDRYVSPLAGPDRLILAVEEVNALSKWTAGIIGAGATAVLGATPVLTGFEYETSAAPDERWLLAAIAAAAACVFVIWVIASLARLRRPLITTLDDLPPDFERRIGKHHGSYLPGDDTSLSEFRKSLRDWQAAAGRARYEADAAPTDTAKRLGAEWAEDQYDNYRRVRDRLIVEGNLRAKLHQSRLPWHVYVAGVIAVVGLVSYIVVLSGKKPDATPAASPTPALLVEYPTAYDQILAGCGATPATGTPITPDSSEPAKPVGASGIPVLLTGGTGTSADPWKLQTFGGTATCPAVTLTGSGEEGFAIVTLNPVAAATTTTSTTTTTAPSTSADDE